MKRLIEQATWCFAFAALGCDRSAERRSETTAHDDERPVWQDGARAWVTSSGRLHASIAWDPAVDNVGPVVYEVAWGLRRMTTHGTQMRLTGLASDRATVIEISASDQSGNRAADVLTTTVSVSGSCTTPRVAMPPSIGGPQP